MSRPINILLCSVMLGLHGDVVAQRIERCVAQRIARHVAWSDLHGMQRCMQCCSNVQQRCVVRLSTQRNLGVETRFLIIIACNVAARNLAVSRIVFVSTRDVICGKSTMWPHLMKSCFTSRRRFCLAMMSWVANHFYVVELFGWFVSRFFAVIIIVFFLFNFILHTSAKSAWFATWISSTITVFVVVCLCFLSGWRLNASTMWCLVPLSLPSTTYNHWILN